MRPRVSPWETYVRAGKTGSNKENVANDITRVPRKPEEALSVA